MNDTSLTYILTTYNKIDFLKIVLSDLLENCTFNEDVVVVDGGSTDGTVEYLNSLNTHLNISTIISEKDKGEAHGFNKAMLLAKGDLIKVITDDDIFHWPSVRACKNYMIANNTIDMMGSNGVGLNLAAENIFSPMNYTNEFNQWKNTNKVFSFCGLGLMIRRSSIPLLGLFDVNYTLVDAEYTLRSTSKKIGLAWLTTPSWVRIANESSNSVKYFEKCFMEQRKLNFIYFGKIEYMILLRHKIRNFIKRFVVKKNVSILTKTDNIRITEIFIKGRTWLQKNSNVDLSLSELNIIK